VERVVVRFVSDDDISHSIETINDGIYTRAQRYIQYYSIVEEGADGNLYTVHVRAAVLVENIRDDLKALGLIESEKKQRETDAPVTVAVTVVGIRSYADFVTLRNALAHEIKEVRRLLLRRVERGVAVFDVDVAGGARVLSAILGLKQFPSFVLGITEMTENSVQCMLLDDRR
jgi:hypothetical protein